MTISSMPSIKYAPQQQVRGFLEAGMLREVVDRVAAVAQFAGPPVDEGRGRAVEAQILEPAVDRYLLFLFGHGYTL